MREVAEIAASVQWAQEQDGTHAWLMAWLLTMFGGETPLPWTARTVLGRPIDTEPQ